MSSFNSVVFIFKASANVVAPLSPILLFPTQSSVSVVF